MPDSIKKEENGIFGLKMNFYVLLRALTLARAREDVNNKKFPAKQGDYMLLSVWIRMLKQNLGQTKAGYRSKNRYIARSDECYFIQTNPNAASCATFADGKHLAKSRGPEGYGQRTYNSYLRAFKEFCGWLIQEDRVAGSDPMKGHSLVRQTEFRKKRRTLTFDEVHKLLKTTETAPKRYNMTGHERSLVYRLALQTGLRAGEIKSLTVLSFDFDAKPATVHVKPSDTKGKRPADLVLMDETANVIREFLSGKEPTDRAFAMPHKANTADMIQADLKDAEIPYTDESGRDVDFHALRHTFISNLALAGVHPAVAQKLARHSSIELTMKYYTHVLHKSEVEAIESLRCLSYACQKGKQRKTSVDKHGQKSVDDDSKKRLSA